MLNKANLRRYLQATRDYVQMGWCRGNLFKDSRGKEIELGVCAISGCLTKFDKLPKDVRKNAQRCCLEGAILLATPTVSKANEVAKYLSNYLHSVNSNWSSLFAFNDNNRDKRSIIRFLNKAIKDIS